MDLIDRLEMEYAPPDHPVFQLVPAIFHEHASNFYAAMGSPTVSFETLWDVYRELLLCFRQEVGNSNADQPLTTVVSLHFSGMEELENEVFDLLDGMKDFRLGGNVVGAATGKDDQEMYASFTDTDGSETEDGPDNDEE
jgi:hypothetical protein